MRSICYIHTFFTSTICKTIIILQLIHSVKHCTPENSANNGLLKYMFINSRILLIHQDLLIHQELKIGAFGALFNLYFVCNYFGLDGMVGRWEDCNEINCVWIQSPEELQIIYFNFLLAKNIQSYILFQFTA